MIPLRRDPFLEALENPIRLERGLPALEGALQSPCAGRLIDVPGPAAKAPGTLADQIIL